MTNRELTVLEEQRVHLSHFGDHEQVVVATRCLAGKAGFGKKDEFLIATAASELATNILRYAKTGDMQIRLVCANRRLGIEIIASDQGPGIDDIERALRDNFTTSENSLGLGLPSVKRIMDEFVIQSQRCRGAYIQVRKWNGALC